MKHFALCILAIVLSIVHAALHAQSPVLADGFKRADSNGDGKLSADEVNQFQQLKTKLQGADKDGDGLITFGEFSTQLIAGARPPSTPSSPSSPATKLTAGEHTRTIAVGDLQRRYRVHVPAKYDAANPTPVVVVFPCVPVMAMEF